MIHALLLSAACAAPAPPQDPPKRPMSWTGVLDEAAFAALHDLKEGAAPPLVGRDIELAGGRAYVSRPKVGPALGAVIVIHEWWGLNDHVKHWADRLASDGYDALAVDLYGGTVATSRDEAMAAMRAVDEAAALATLRAAHAYATSADGLAAERTASIGWCFGGAWSLRLAVAEPELDAAVIYYGRLIEDAGALASLVAPVLGVFGNLDTGIPPESVATFAAAMKSAGKSLELRQYDAHHAFANPSGARYDAENAAKAWTETRGFLARHLAPPQRPGTFHDGRRPLEVTVPDRWRRGEGRMMRLATFTFDACECVVSAFSGDVGGLRPNVDRWRQQLGLGAITDEDFAALPTTPMLGGLATLLRVEGLMKTDSDPARPSVMLVAAARLDDETVFVKLTGPTQEVDDARDAFLALCRNLR